MLTIVIQGAFLTLFLTTAILTLIFLVRQIVLSLIAVNSERPNPYGTVELDPWPTVTILVPAHNEERVIAGCLDHLLALEYPKERLAILVVNDRSTDDTREIIDTYAGASAGRIRALHRAPDAVPGKPAAIADALELVDSEILVFFDADYLPHPPLLRKLVAPFLDPQVGATMGRVVPYNTSANLLTGLLDLERRGGYTIDQAARNIMNLLPQFGGTVGGIRVAAMDAVGGWSAHTLAEDTDLTYRLFIAGWTVEYVDEAMCYEESPESWEVRIKQVRRWACGHDECFFRYFRKTLTTPNQPLYRRLDAALVLVFFLYPPLAFLNLIASLIYPTLFSYSPFNFAIVSAIAFVVGFGNFSLYIQIIAAVIRDRQHKAAALLPFVFLSSTISMLAATQGLFFALRGWLLNRHLGWDKTIRFRRRKLVRD